MGSEAITVRSAWISDVHLGARDAKVDYLLDILQKLQCDTLFLVGDMIDFWALKKKFHWPESHQAIIEQLMKMARTECRVVYIPGNHDAIFRECAGGRLGEIEIHRQYIHETADNKQLLVTHGDELDNVIRFNRFIKLVGDGAYDFLLFANRWVNYARQKLGYDYWSLAAVVKSKVGNARKAIETFEEAAFKLARAQGVDGVVCGHIHQPNIRCQENTLYCNDGDWIENCSMLVEKHTGHLEIIHYSTKMSINNPKPLVSSAVI